MQEVPEAKITLISIWIRVGPVRLPVLGPGDSECEDSSQWVIWLHIADRGVLAFKIISLLNGASTCQVTVTLSLIFILLLSFE